MILLDEPELMRCLSTRPGILGKVPAAYEIVDKMRSVGEKPIRCRKPRRCDMPGSATPLSVRFAVYLSAAIFV
jgi:hypothetical protein